MSNVIQLSRHRTPGIDALPPVQPCEVFSFPKRPTLAPDCSVFGMVEFITEKDQSITVDLSAPFPAVFNVFQAADGAGGVELMRMDDKRGAFILLNVSPCVAARMETVARGARMRVAWS